LLTTPQDLVLFQEESRDAIYRRLQRLFHHGYLGRLGSNPNAPLLYALDRRGADILEVPFRKDSGDRYVAHQLMIGTFRIALTLATQKQGIELSWRRFGGEHPVKPDGFFGLRFPELPDGRNQAFFCLEADRSTMTTTRFVDKLARYAAWYDAGGHTRAAGIRNFRVLTVTRSEERVRSLLGAVGRATELTAHLHRCWFTSENRLISGLTESVFGRIWHIAGRGNDVASLIAQ
jgi:Replication-relaxation